MLDILYGKKKKLEPTSTMTSGNATFDLGVNSQMQPKKEESLQSDICVTPTVNVNISDVELKSPVVTIDQPKITVCPVVNLHSQDLVRNADGHIVLPKIDVALTININ